jgi:hypothetical protein
MCGLDLAELRFVIMRLRSKIVWFLKEIIWMGVIFRQVVGVLDVEGFGLVVELGVGLGGHESKGGVPFVIDWREIEFGMAERRHHTRVDIIVGHVVIGYLGRGIVGIEGIGTRGGLISGFLQVVGLSPAGVLLLQVLAIHLYFVYCDKSIN